MTTIKENTVTTVRLNIDAETWKQFRILCINENTSVSAKLSQFVHSQLGDKPATKGEGSHGRKRA